MLTFFAENPIAAVIVGCEIGLWVLLGLGMVMRYLVGSADQYRRARGHSPAGRRAGDPTAMICTAAPTSGWCTCGRASPWALTGVRRRSCAGRTLGSLAGSPAGPPRAHSQKGPERVAHLISRVVSRRWHGRDRVCRARGAHPVLRRTGGPGGPVVVDRPGVGGRRPWFVFGPMWETREEVSDGAAAAACRWCRARPRAAWRPGSGRCRRGRRGS